MDQIHGSQEPERQGQEPDGNQSRLDAYRALAEGAARFHILADPERLGAHIIDVLTSILGPCSGILVLRHESGDESYGFGGMDAELASRPQIAAAIAKAMEAGTPVVDGQAGERYVVVPLNSSTRHVGAVYVGVSALERRLGNAYLDHLALMANHAGIAVDNAIKVRDIAAAGGHGVGYGIPSGLSLRDSKRFFEHRLVRERLNDARGNIAAAARSLDMDRGQLSRLLKKHSIDKMDFRHKGHS